MTIERDEMLEGLLEVERTIPEPAGGMKERVLERVLEAGMLPAAINVRSGGEGVPGGDVPGNVSGGNVVTASAAKLWAVAAAAFLGGSVFGAGIYHAVQDEPVVDVATPAPTSPVPPVEAESIEAESIEAESVEEPPPEPDVELEEQAPRPPRRVAPVGTAPDSEETATATESELAEERALIDVARSAIGRRRPASALSALERHAERFPAGHLSEERQGLFVLAYARAGNMEDARQAAEQFRRRYPRSLMNRAIDSVLNE